MLVGGFLVVRKTRQWDVIWAFFVTVLATLAAASAVQGTAVLGVAREMVLASPLFFFAFAMLTEPLTAPSTHTARLWYGALVGFLFVPLVHFGPLSFTPSLRSWPVTSSPTRSDPRPISCSRSGDVGSSPPGRTSSSSKETGPSRSARGSTSSGLCPIDGPDNRGVRRYLTVASSPADRLIRVGVRFSPESSTFKQRLLAMKRDDKLFAGHLAGNFVLPRRSRGEAGLHSREGSE